MKPILPTHLPVSPMTYNVVTPIVHYVPYILHSLHTNTKQDVRPLYAWERDLYEDIEGLRRQMILAMEEEIGETDW